MIYALALNEWTSADQGRTDDVLLGMNPDLFEQRIALAKAAEAKAPKKATQKAPKKAVE
jgi:hypothetical protein